MLSLQAVLAVLKHKLAEAADSGQTKGNAAAAAATKQLVEAAQKEAEAKAAKQLQCMAEQVRVPCWWVGSCGRGMMPMPAACISLAATSCLQLNSHYTLPQH